MYRRFFSGVMVLTLLMGTLGASAPAASAPGVFAPRVVQAATISIDGVVDAVYGAPHASDPGGDGNGNANMDLLDLYIAEDNNYYYFAFTINDDIETTNWGKYVIYIDTTNDANGATSDAWGRSVIVNDPHKPEYGIYAWVDGSEFGPGSTQLVPWAGSEWNWGSAKSVFAAARAFNGTVSVIEYQVAKADLGNAGQLWVEVWNTGGGGGDNAQDTINNPPGDWNATDWSTQAVLACSTPYGAPIVDGFVDAIYGLPVASDPAGDGNGNANMDLLDLHVTDDAYYYYFAFTINGDIVTTDWGKYVIYIDTTNDANGATNDAWGRNVVVNDPHKPEYGIYAWVDGGGFGPGNTQLVPWTGSGWDWGSTRQVLAAARAFDGSTSAIEYQVPKAFFGDADQLWVEVWNTGGGGGDNAQDTINDPPDDWNATDWSTQAVLACSTEVLARNYPVEKPVASHDNSVWWDGLAHDSRNDLYRQPFGAVPTETPITLRFRTYANDVTGVKVRLWDTTLGQQTVVAMNKVTTIPGETFDYDIWELQMTAPDYLTVLYYRFIVTDGTDTDYYEDDDLYDGGLGQPYDESPDRSWQIDVYAPDFTVPDWFKDAVVYQIFPDRFRNGVTTNDPISGTFFYDEDPGVVTAPQWNWPVPDPRVAGEWEGSYSKLFYGGDLQGIIDKLDYLQDLGVNTLYLNPIFEAPSNHKYDTTDYSVIDDNFGDLATYITLTTELENRGMHLILDGVFNHTSSDSMYFDRYGRYETVGACESLTSTYRSWYYFSPASPPGTGVCAGDTNYEAWWGFDSLPKLNTTNVPAVRSYIYSDTQGIARTWLTQGADGWRLDVAGDVDASFWRDWRDDIRDANADAITIAEEWGDASRFILGDQLDSTMNYRFRNAVIGVLRETDWQDTNSTIRALSLSQFDSVMHGIEEDYPAEAFYAMMNLVGGHDVNRVLIPLDQDGDPTDADYSDGKLRQKMLVLIQMTMPGAPTIYYGDEVGLVGYGEATSGNAGGVFYSDPYNRQPYPWPDEEGYNGLETWRQADLDMLAHYSTTAAIRNTNAALRTGSFDTLLVDDEAGIYAYGRGQAAVIGLNFGTMQTLTIPVDGYLHDGAQLMDELNGGNYEVLNGEIVIPAVPPMWGAILVLKSLQPTPPPPAPTNLAAVEGNGEVMLTWDVVASAASYNVYRSYVYGGGYTYLGQATTLNYTDTTVTNGTLYYYVVTAVSAPGSESDFSNEVSALPHVNIDWANLQWPHEFTHTVGITPTQDICGQVYIAGVTSEPGATEGLLAQVGFGASMTDFTAWTTWVDAIFNSDAGNNDEFKAQLLPEEPGDFVYLYRYSTTGGRDWVYAGIDGTVMIPVPGVMHVLPAVDTTPPPTPLNLRVVHWGTDHITVQWDPVSADDLAGYDLYRYAEGEAPATFLARVMEPTTIYTDTDVVVNTTYTYTVQAFDTSLNKSNFSNPASGTAAAREVEVRFRVTVPPFTPAGDTIYIAGDNATYLGASWNPGARPITRLDATTWAYTVTIPEETALQYKFTRGTWDVVENWGDLVGEANRHLTVAYGDDGVMLVEDVVYNWRDPLVVEHYPAAGATAWDTAEPIWALISRPIDPTRVTASTFVVEQSGGGVVLGALGVQPTTFDPYPDTALLPYINGSLVVFTPTTALNLHHSYTVTLVASGYYDDVTMRANYAWTFGGQPLYIYLPLVMRVYTP